MPNVFGGATDEDTIPGSNGTAPRVGSSFGAVLSLAMLADILGSDQDEEGDTGPSTTTRRGVLMMMMPDGRIAMGIPVSMMRSATQSSTDGEDQVPSAGDEGSDGEQ
jgi:hypothetical protein